MPPLTPPEREAFLQEPGVLCRIATVRADGAPHVTPVWFVAEAGELFITPRSASSWLESVRREPRVALVIDEATAPYRKVTIEGAARIAFDLGHDDEWRELYRRIAARYVPPDVARRYIETTIDQPRALIAVPLTAARVRTWRMPLQGEPYSGIWHRRYYAPGTKMADD